MKDFTEKCFSKSNKNAHNTWKSESQKYFYTHYNNEVLNLLNRGMSSGSTKPSWVNSTVYNSPAPFRMSHGYLNL